MLRLHNSYALYALLKLYIIKKKTDMTLIHAVRILCLLSLYEIINSRAYKSKP